MTNNEQQQLIDALKVMTLTPHINAYLKAHDPKALEQARKALAVAEGRTVDSLDWHALGRELRRNSLDAHREVVDVSFAYGFLLENPDCFLDDDAEWPVGMPQEPNIELIVAYYQSQESDAPQE